MLFFGGLIGVAMLVCGVASGVVGYVSIASALPPPDELERRATQLFTSSQIYDRDGNLLYELLDTEGGRRTFVPLDKISPWLQHATIATEDPRFYRHPGFDVFGIARAIVQNVRAGEGVSGASTIAQQLVLNLLLPEGRERTLTRKVREVVLAAEVTRQYPRDKILELYLFDQLWQSGLWHRSGSAHVFQQRCRGPDARRSFAAGRHSASACCLRSVYDGRARRRPGASEGRAALDDGRKLHHHRRSQTRGTGNGELRVQSA
jgi:hypothetical protein